MALPHTRKPAGKSTTSADVTAPLGHVAIGQDDRSLAERFLATRKQTESLCEPLETEDFVISTMSDVSPTKWHLAHTSWFFETFVLTPHAPDYESPNPKYSYLFNSYHVRVGERHSRSQRGLTTRPTVREVFEYRAIVDEHLHTLIDRIGGDAAHPATSIIELGLQHEQQHQELLLTDIKHVFWMNPLRPVYTRRAPEPAREPAALEWDTIPEGVHAIGHDGHGFAFDNEQPRHRELVPQFRIATRPITNAEYLKFIDDDGYRRTELWLSNAWAMVQEHGWKAPLYWENEGSDWTEFSLAGGTRPLDPAEPVTHVSYFEADAFARWSGKRLPTEAEWEVAARAAPIVGTFVESRRFHPAPASGGDGGRLRPMESPLVQLYGDVWQWTQSPYVGYPGYIAPPGAIGEYNGKWMADQWVLRGASCATPRSHARPTYRNFLPSDARWQFSGIRLASQP